MQLEHSFTVPVGVDEAWRILLDVERIGPCLPGAAVDTVDGDDFTGSVKVKLGPINLTYKGKASFVEKDETAHRAVIDARGRDARGNGTATAKVTATLCEADGTTSVRVETDLDITGKPAQFGRGVMVDVGNKLIGQFAECLSRTIAGGERPTPEAAAPPPVGSAPASAAPAYATPTVEPGAAAEQPVAPAAEAAAAVDPGTVSTVNARSAPQPRPEVEPINLLESAGPAVAKRLAPVAVAGLIVLVALARRRRARRG